MSRLPDDLVAGRGDPDPLPGREQRADHPGPGPRLPGAGRSLDGERRLVEREDQPTGSLELRFCVPNQPLPGALTGARRVPQEEVATGPIRTRCIDPVGQDPFADGDEDVLVVGRFGTS